MKHSLIALALVTASPAWADCDGTTAQMLRCGVQLLEQADAELNLAYKGAMARARSGGYHVELRAAQRAWIPYRDASCTAEAAPHAGGTIQPLIRIGCLTALTESRTIELLQFGRF